MSGIIQPGQTGYIPGNFDNNEMHAYALGPVDAHPFLFKAYELFSENHPHSRVGDSVRSDFEKFLKTQAPHLPKEAGIGFAILGKDTVNIARWSAEHPIVLKNSLYGFRKNILEAKELDIKEAGAYCIWELGIVNHERRIWKKYLDSKRTRMDLCTYLEDNSIGDLIRTDAELAELELSPLE